MLHARQDILEAALKLAPADRAELLEELSASLDEFTLSKEWEAEIQRRIEDIDSGRVQPIAAEDVFARLDQRLARE